MIFIDDNIWFRKCLIDNDNKLFCFLFICCDDVIDRYCRWCRRIGNFVVIEFFLGGVYCWIYWVSYCEVVLYGEGGFIDLCGMVIFIVGCWREVNDEDENMIFGWLYGFFERYE